VADEVDDFNRLRDVEQRAADPRRRIMTPDEAFDRLHHAGWSVGDVVSGGTWIVSGHNGENAIDARARTQAEAWRGACEQAAAVGMLAPPRPGDDDHEPAHDPR
jgi:hypothetical protein